MNPAVCMKLRLHIYDTCNQVISPDKYAYIHNKFACLPIRSLQETLDMKFPHISQEAMDLMKVSEILRL